MGRGLLLYIAVKRLAMLDTDILTNSRSFHINCSVGFAEQTILSNMKKIGSLMFLILFAICATSCGDDDENNGTNGNAIEINGVMRTVSTIAGLEGSWNSGSGEFTLTIDNVKNGTNDLEYYMFSFQSAADLKKGDDVSKMKLTLSPPEASYWESYSYQSGKATVMDTNKEKSEITIKFEQLEMVYKGDIYKFNGTAILMYDFGN